MKIYSCQQTSGWGDAIPKIWVLEYIKHHVPDAEIILCDNETECRISAAIKLDFASEILDKDPDQTFDYSLHTHHRHWASTISDRPLRFGKPLYFDLHGFKFKMVKENWYPSFRPTNKLIEEYRALGLPEVYDCWALSDDKTAMNRNNIEAKQWIQTNLKSELRDKNIPIVSTNEFVPASIDCTDLSGWLKIAVMIGARKLLCSQSGFTAIASMYRQRKNSWLVNYNPEIALLTGPPAVCYENCQVVISSEDWKNLYWTADNYADWHNYYPEWTHRDCSVNYFRYNSQYEGLNLRTFQKAPETYVPVPVSFIRENCLVPESTQFRLDDNKWETLIPSNRVWAWIGTHQIGQLI